MIELRLVENICPKCRNNKKISSCFVEVKKNKKIIRKIMFPDLYKYFDLKKLYE